MIRLLLLAFVMVGLFSSCGDRQDRQSQNQPVTVALELEIPNRTIDNSALSYDNKTSLWTLNDQLFSGYSVDFYEDGVVKEKFGILEGRKQNQSVQRYPDGHFKLMANYQRGKLHGEKKTWSPDSIHTLVSYLNYVSGKVHGEQKQWYQTGELYKKVNLNMGKEEGIQQAYRKNGALYANYEAKNGRIFGMKKAALCFGVEDQNIRYEQ
jgi:hypothetical protein